MSISLTEAKKLYINAGGPNDHCENEWKDIQQEMQTIIESKSDRSAGKTILWWGCWDNKYTATAFARKVRNNYNAPAQRPTKD